MADQRIAGAYVEVYQKGAEKVGQDVERAARKVKQHLPEEEVGAFEKFLFGKHGTAGIEHTLIHLGGHMAKMFAAGGLFAVGAIVTEKLTEAIANNVLGLEKQAKAAEAAAKGIDRYKESTDKLNMAAVAEETKTKSSATEQLEASMFPPGLLDRVKSRMREREEEATKARATEAEARANAANVRITPEEQEQMRAEAFRGKFLPSEATIRGETEAAEAAERQRRVSSSAARAEAAKARAAGLETANSLDAMLLGGLATGARGLAGQGGLASILAGGARGAENMLGGLGGSPASVRARLAASGQGQGLGGMNMADLTAAAGDVTLRRNELAKRQAFAPEQSRIGGPTDIGSIGAQMQQALFQQSPFDREWEALDREQLEVMKAMDAKLGALKQGGAVVAANR